MIFTKISSIVDLINKVWEFNFNITTQPQYSKASLSVNFKELDRHLSTLSH